MAVSPRVKMLRAALKRCGIEAIGGIRIERFRLSDHGDRWTEYGAAQTIVRGIEPVKRLKEELDGIHFRGIGDGRFLLVWF